jgi:EAL domain-containing protein (putative c-di-GMP-specific phosphodiesterase class I)
MKLTDGEARGRLPNVAGQITEQEGQVLMGIFGPFMLSSAFQPIFRFVDGKLRIAAFEGLVRPVREGKRVSPGAFFKLVPATDRLGIETLTRTLHLQNAARFLDPSTYLFVNFDPSVYTEAEVARDALRGMLRTLDDFHIDRARVVCEVTEKRVRDADSLVRFVDTLRGNQFKIAVDDYGAEDSDISRIDALKPDIVKFDAEWITKLMDNDAGPALMKAMVNTFADRGIVNLFEGIEEDWQLVLADELSVDLVQGFVVAKPENAPTSFSVFSGSDTNRKGVLPSLFRDPPILRRRPITPEPVSRHFAGLDAANTRSKPVDLAIIAAVGSGPELAEPPQRQQYCAPAKRAFGRRGL